MFVRCNRDATVRRRATSVTPLRLPWPTGCLPCFESTLRSPEFPPTSGTNWPAITRRCGTNFFLTLKEYAAPGWRPCHLALWRGDTLAAALQLYLKHHSRGEYGLLCVGPRGQVLRITQQLRL
ncbi:peptidogalycan biosysnthesis protein [Chitinolyticbacter albus]|uniref:peptidogalycan biosysnthesis protein n=1 Tax=Chitinolyticbacter albus TaxID=2961951 RepID=UPI003571040E